MTNSLCSCSKLPATPDRVALGVERLLLVARYFAQGVSVCDYVNGLMRARMSRPRSSHLRTGSRLSLVRPLTVGFLSAAGPAHEIAPRRLRTMATRHQLEVRSRNRTASATSSGWTISAAGTLARSVIGVATSPGQMAVAWTPSAAISRCTDPVIEITAALVAE